MFAVLFNDHVYRKPELRKLLEEEHLYGRFTARYLRRCEQLHKRWPNFDPRPMADWLAIEGATETEQSSMSKFTAWASASDRKMADLAKHIQSAKEWMAWGFWAHSSSFGNRYPSCVTGCVALRWHSRRGAIERGWQTRRPRRGLALWHRDARKIVRHWPRLSASSRVAL